jgi:cyanate lyase
MIPKSGYRFSACAKPCQRLVLSINASAGEGRSEKIMLKEQAPQARRPAMASAMASATTRTELTEKLLGIKRENGWSWKHICAEIGGMSPVLITGAILGQMKLSKPQAAKAAELFGLSKAEQALLNEVPHRGSAMPPTDPLIYRFYELVMVNGPALKVLIEEEFGDGIMSAIDFDLAMERQPDPKGDRVKISMSGKFLPYKYYGATGNVPTYGYKEE